MIMVWKCWISGRSGCVGICFDERKENGIEEEGDWFD